MGIVNVTTLRQDPQGKSGREDRMEITGEIFQVGGGQLSSPEDAAIYLIRIGDGAALVDAGCGGATARVLSNIRALDVRPESIQYLLITHCHFDHTGGAEALQASTGCRVVAHELDAVYLEEGNEEVTAASWYGRSATPLRVDVKLSGKRNELEIGGRIVEAIHAPGHSPGSVVYLMESDGRKVLFAQDVHGPLHPSLLSSREDYLHSLDLLLSLDADILCEGHYGVYTGRKEVAGFIRRFLS